jgi:hypothetical protein
MIHPKRLLEGDGTELERLLLASGRAARPNPRAKWRTGILVFFMGIGTISKAQAVALLGAKARAWTVAQWLALGVGTGAAGWVAVHAKADVPPDPVMAVADPPLRRIPAAPISRDEPPSVLAQPLPAPPLLNGVESSASPPLVARTPVPAPPAVSRPKRSASLATASTVVEPSTAERSIASEIEELDRAREALGTSGPKRAIDRLNRYDRLFPQGTLREEALRLRIEAAVILGERATARSLAQRFQGLYPDSTHSERLKALVRDP